MIQGGVKLYFKHTFAAAYVGLCRFNSRTYYRLQTVLDLCNGSTSGSAL